MQDTGCALLPAGVDVEITAEGDDGLPLQVWLLRYRVSPGLESLQRSEPVLLPSDSGWRADLEELAESIDDVQPLGLLRTQSRFQSMMVRQLDFLQLQETRSLEDMRQQVEDTILYLHHAYRRNIRIEQLSEQTTLSRWQYNQLFKSMTGGTPLQYLTELRMDQAKRLLADPTRRMRAIAEQVGFRDEYYFSRRFKQEVGVSPSVYARMTVVPSLRICAVHSLGDLLALGIRPVASTRTQMTWLGYMDCEPLDDPPNPEQLAALRPDLIVCPSYLPKETHTRLSALAPTVLLDWQDPIGDRLAKLGRLLDRSVEAKAWLGRYEQTAAYVREEVALPDRTAAAFTFHEQRLYVYGGHNFGHTLYSGLGLQPPERLRERIASGGLPLKWRRIETEELADYAADWMFLTVEEQDRPTPAFRAITDSQSWREQSAARRGQARIVDHRWGLYDATTLERHLEAMRTLMAVPNRPTGRPPKK